MVNYLSGLLLDEDKPKDTDGRARFTYLRNVSICKVHEWLAEANHGMRKDFEDKALLFPRFDSS